MGVRYVFGPARSRSKVAEGHQIAIGDIDEQDGIERVRVAFVPGNFPARTNRIYAVYASAPPAEGVDPAEYLTSGPAGFVDVPDEPAEVLAGASLVIEVPDVPDGEYHVQTVLRFDS